MDRNRPPQRPARRAARVATDGGAYPIPHRQLDQHPDRQFTPSLTIASFVAPDPA